MFFLSKRNAKTLNQNTKFTIAKIISNWHHKNNNGFGVDYEYYVKNVRFQKTVNLNVSKGQKFLIAFDSIHPKRSLLLTDYEINDDLIESKEAEWNYKQIPFSIDSIKVTDDIKNKNAFTIFTK
ncbi:hypothetical protein [Halpernia sp. GG3]